MFEYHRETDEKSSSENSLNEKVKKITIFRNGNHFDSGRKIVWNPKQIRTWDAFIDYLSCLTQSPIRIISTPTNGSSVKQYNEIEQSGVYVAIDKYQKFIPIDYIGNSKRLGTNKWNTGKIQKKNIKSINGDSQTFKSVQDKNSRNKLPKLPRIQNTKIIFVFRNGDNFSMPTKIILNHRNFSSMEAIIESIAEKIILLNNKPITRIYTSNGKLAKSADEIFHLEDYVAASNEGFIDCNYEFRFFDRSEKKINMTNYLAIDHGKFNVQKDLFKGNKKPKIPTKNKSLETTENQKKVNKIKILPPIGIENKNSDNIQISSQRIQSAFIGFKNGKPYPESNIAEIQNRCAIIIQSAFRDYLTKKNSRKHTSTNISKLDKNEAAQCIQASFRGWKLRKALGKYLEKLYYLTDS